MSQKKTGQTKRKLFIINTAIVLSVLSGLIWLGIKYFDLDKSNFTDDAQVESFINPINSRVSGYIQKINFQEHQAVKKGDTLVVLWAKELRIAVEQAEAAYLNALAAKDVSSSSVNTVRNSVAVSNANAQAVKARMLNAQKNLKRYEALLKDDVVTRQQYEQVLTEYEALKAQYEALRGQRETSELSTIEAGKRININAAEVKRTKAALDLAKLNLSYSFITAPYDGVVGRRTIQQGQLIQAGQTLITLVSGEDKWVTANYREKQLPGIALGQEVKITVDALNDKVFDGKVTAISEATGAKYSAVPVDNSTGNFVKVQQRIPVRIEFTDKNSREDLELLRAGMNVEIETK